jgi:MFS family permease
VSAVSAAAYRGLLAEPALRRLAIADAFARLPQGMVSITVLLVAAEHASMAVAGLVVAGYTLGQAVTGPVRGRLADRYGLTRVAACCTLGYALALLALLAGAITRAPAGLLIGAATTAGLVNPPLSPGMRSLWSARAGARFTQAAFALDAAVFDLAYIIGPVLAGALATGFAPAAALGLMLALTGAAVVIIGRQPRDRPAGRPRGRPAGPPPERRSRPRFPLRSAGLGCLLLTGALVNAALTATEVALTGYARYHDALWAAGPLLAGVSAGSILGSLLLGARTSGARTSPGRLRGRPGPAHRGRALPAAARRGRPAGRAVPGAGAGHLVQRGGGRGAQRQRHGNAGVAELDHERRSGGRRRGGRRAARPPGPGRDRSEPSRPGLCPGLCPGAGRGGERRRRGGSHVSGARARPVR